MPIPAAPTRYASACKQSKCDRNAGNKAITTICINLDNKAKLNLCCALWCTVRHNCISGWLEVPSCNTTRSRLLVPTQMTNFHPIAYICMKQTQCTYAATARKFWPCQPYVHHFCDALATVLNQVTTASRPRAFCCWSSL